ncbi:MAG: UDP-2,3-diacylglucosamine diphosphatase, partial [Cyclobacteriaceae bacterium]
MSERKNTYFASDLHLGAPTYEKSREREVLFVQWLDSIEPTAKEIYLLGDVFDFWFEFKSTIPKGYARLQGKLAELTDKGIPIYWMKGNHDMWMFGYLEKELGVQIIDQPVLKTFGDKQFYLAHGDGLGPKQRTYKLIRKFSRSCFAQRLFAFLHPTFGLWLAS